MASASSPESGQTMPSPARASVLIYPCVCDMVCLVVTAAAIFYLLVPCIDLWPVCSGFGGCVSMMRYLLLCGGIRPGVSQTFAWYVALYKVYNI